VTVSPLLIAFALFAMSRPVLSAVQPGGLMLAIAVPLPMSHTMALNISKKPLANPLLAMAVPSIFRSCGWRGQRPIGVSYEKRSVGLNESFNPTERRLNGGGNRWLKP